MSRRVAICLTRQPDPQARRRALALLAFAALLAGIFALAYAGRVPGLIAALPHYDAYGHVILYGLLCYLAHRACQRLSLRATGTRLPGLPLALMATLAVAVAEELLQDLSPVRTVSWRDVAADLAGMLMALAFDAVWQRRHTLARWMAS